LAIAVLTACWLGTLVALSPARVVSLSTVIAPALSVIHAAPV
jgi:hypothetical protein